MESALILAGALAIPAVIWLLAGHLVEHVRAADFQHRLNRWRWPAKGE